MEYTLGKVMSAARFRSALREFDSHTVGACRRHGLTPQRYLLLLLIKGTPDGTERTSVGELAERLFLEPHTVSGLAARAEEAGLVEREPSETDARVVYLRLTDHGDQCLQAAFHDLERQRARMAGIVGKLW